MPVCRRHDVTSVTPLQIGKDLFKENQKKKWIYNFHFFAAVYHSRVSILKVTGGRGVLNEKKKC